ncbi:hypothetical protein [Haloparvum sedimenti]|uniref:hypothetical protein n=1 Tax=Haloparvum sedimenti TaxID=1678448 RepID=UPI00071E6DE4|nr:hypothetical protein [Haloparvum sedimenti]
MRDRLARIPIVPALLGLIGVAAAISPFIAGSATAWSARIAAFGVLLVIVAIVVAVGSGSEDEGAYSRGL